MDWFDFSLDEWLVFEDQDYSDFLIFLANFEAYVEAQQLYRPKAIGQPMKLIDMQAYLPMQYNRPAGKIYN